jgi:formamidopyrimidine-DNA glycosylase
MPLARRGRRVPELPEVETIRRQLEAVLPGQQIAEVEIWDARLVAPQAPEALVETLVGRRFEGLDRRGKYLQLLLDDGLVLVIHLRMTGQIYWSETGHDPTIPYPRAVIRTCDGGSLLYCDLRRFGRWWMLDGTDPEIERYWSARVGVEPLSRSFTAAHLGKVLTGRRTAIKAALLDQRLLAGVGNIYADEALFQAGVHPQRPAGGLSPSELRRLHRAIRDRLTVALDAGGSSIDRYRDTTGGRGSMQTLLRVHLREGLPCGRCRSTIRKIRVAQRGTYICERCQPPC